MKGLLRNLANSLYGLCHRRSRVVEGLVFRVLVGLEGLGLRIEGCKVLKGLGSRGGIYSLKP